MLLQTIFVVRSEAVLVKIPTVRILEDMIKVMKK